MTDSLGNFDASETHTAGLKATSQPSSDTRPQLPLQDTLDTSFMANPAGSGQDCSSVRAHAGTDNTDVDEDEMLLRQAVDSATAGP